MNKVARQDLIAEFNRLAEELDKRPTLSEFNEHGEYSSTPVYNVFGSFEDLKDAAGFETGPDKVSKESIRQDVQRVAEKIGRSPPLKAYQEHGNHDPKTAKKRFGSWHDVLEKCGLEPTDHSEHWEDTEYDYEPQGGNVMVPCDHCGDPTPKWEHQIENNEYAYCGRRCKGAAMSEQTGEEARSWEGGKVEIVCEWCGDTKTVKPSKVDKSRFCSQGCMVEWRVENFSGEDHPRWNGGYNRYYGPNWYQQRREVLERDDYECQSCPVDREQHNERYGCDPVVHHITRFGDFDNYKEANELSNLITLCKRCHGLVEAGRKELPESATNRI